MEQNSYDKQACEFLDVTGSSLVIRKIGHGKYWPSDKCARDIYRFTLTNKEGKTYTAKFGQSVRDTEAAEAPRPYDILACLSGYEPPSDLQEFCLMFGYEVNQISHAQRTFEALQEEYRALNDMYTPSELDLLNDIN